MVDTDEKLVYYFRHISKDAYADKDGLPVKDWNEAITFNDVQQADTFYMAFHELDMSQCVPDEWDMCQCSPELWESSGGRKPRRNYIRIDDKIWYLED